MYCARAHLDAFMRSLVIKPNKESPKETKKTPYLIEREELYDVLPFVQMLDERALLDLGLQYLPK